MHGEGKSLITLRFIFKSTQSYAITFRKSRKQRQTFGKY